MPVHPFIHRAAAIPSSVKDVSPSEIHDDIRMRSRLHPRISSVQAQSVRFFGPLSCPFSSYLIHPSDALYLQNCIWYGPVAIRVQDKALSNNSEETFDFLTCSECHDNEP